jgi:hypothetical protein
MGGETRTWNCLGRSMGNVYPEDEAARLLGQRKEGSAVTSWEGLVIS